MMVVSGVRSLILTTDTVFSQKYMNHEQIFQRSGNEVRLQSDRSKFLSLRSDVRELISTKKTHC